MITQENIQFITSIATLIGLLFVIYKFFRDPDTKASEDIKLINQRCGILHGAIDENISLIKNNHLKHIEESMATMKSDIVEIKTILKERNGKF